MAILQRYYMNNTKISIWHVYR